MKVYVIEKSIYQENGEVVKYIAKVVNSRENAEAFIEYMKIIEKDKKDFIFYWINEEEVSELNYTEVMEVMKLLESKN